jgi:hypothetical protein
MSIGLFNRFHFHSQPVNQPARLGSSSTSTSTSSASSTSSDDGGLHAECKALCKNLAGFSRHTDNSGRIGDIRRLISMLPDVDSHKRTAAETGKAMGKRAVKSLVKEVTQSGWRSQLGGFLPLSAHSPQLSAPSVPVNHTQIDKIFYQVKAKSASSLPYVASTHKRAFDEIMWQLKPRYNFSGRWILKNADPIHHYDVYRDTRSRNERSAAPDEVRRRQALAPAWADLILQSGCLKPERQKLMTDMFEANLVDTKPEDRKSLAGAYGDSFSALAATLPALADPAHPDTLSPAQGTAISLLKQYATSWYLNPQQQVDVTQALDEASAALNPQEHEILMIEIGRIRNSMVAEQ